MKSIRLLVALLFCAVTGHPAPLSGRLAYVQNGAAFVLMLPNGKPKMLPNSRGARIVSIAPKGGTVLFFVTQKQTRAFITRPPYAAAKLLPAPLDKFEPGNVQWTQDGASVLLASWDKSYLWHMATGKVLALPAGDATLSRDGSQVAFATEKEIKLRRMSDGSERVLFFIARPQPLFTALKSARYPKNLRELQDAISPDLWKDATMWNFGSLVFSADGKTLWFACNAGTGAGAAGNTTWCWFACDLQSGHLASLSKLGAQFSRLPGDIALSPDGKKLLYSESVHSSAIENPVAVSVLDLLTQRATIIAQMTIEKKYDANLIYGACWSPDSRAVAASAFYYDTQKIMKNPEWQPRDADFTLYLRDLNGRTLRRIPGAVAPSWGN